MFDMHEFSDQELDISTFIEQHRRQCYQELKDDPRFLKWKKETDLEKRKEIIKELRGDTGLAQVTLARLVSKSVGTKTEKLISKIAAQ